jgi:uncharacterized protein YecT (DUF1311 family)
VGQYPSFGRPVRDIEPLRIALALVMFAVGAVPAAAPAALGPPVIHEPWTPLPCPTHPNSTIEIEGCLERAITRSDRTINSKSAKIFRLIRRNSERAAFVRGERAWLLYRRQSCTAEASIFRGGSAEPVAFLTCEKRRNTRHISDLIDMERTLLQG